jgi:hypothetical protein
MKNDDRTNGVTKVFAAQAFIVRLTRPLLHSARVAGESRLALLLLSQPHTIMKVVLVLIGAISHRKSFVRGASTFAGPSPTWQEKH